MVLDEIRRRLGTAKPKVGIKLGTKELFLVKSRPTDSLVTFGSKDAVPKYFIQEGDATQCVSFATCNALREQMRNHDLGLLPFTPRELFSTIQNIDGAIDSSTGMLTQLGILNLFSQAQKLLNIAQIPLEIEGCKDFDMLQKGLSEGKSAVVFDDKLSHELALLSYNPADNNLVVFDSLGDGLTKTYKFNEFKSQIGWGTAGTANRLIAYKPQNLSKYPSLPA